MWLLAAIFLGLSIQETDEMDCFSCLGVDSISDCHNVTTCNSQQVCYTHSTVGPQISHYDLGCVDTQGCQQTSGSGFVGRSVAANTSSNQCFRCCAVDGCNKGLCKPSAGGTGCHDDPTYNCATINQMFNICSDVHHAKIVCRSFCKLCGLVDGHWSDWSTWSDCSVTCETGQRSRVRSCTNPAPAQGGLTCPGNQTEAKSCTVGRLCPVDGEWSTWSPWEPCSATCGAGLKVRARNCSNPYPTLFGQHCFGDFHDYAMCTSSSCPVDAHWSAWATWSPCSATCGSGFTTRARNCDNATHSTSGGGCIGDSIQYRQCQSSACTVTSTGTWGMWEAWSSCDVTCGYGSRQRSRSCTHPGNYGCAGQSFQVYSCRTLQCPIDGLWTVWGSWSGCPSQFVIQRIRIRLCVGPFYSGTNCAGANSETKIHSCLFHGTASPVG